MYRLPSYEYTVGSRIKILRQSYFHLKTFMKVYVNCTLYWMIMVTTVSVLGVKIKLVFFGNKK